jgi:hypothetical protein
MPAAFDWLAWASTLNPATAVVCVTPGVFWVRWPSASAGRLPLSSAGPRQMSTTCFTTASVRARLAPSGSRMLTTAYPWSWFGMNPPGTMPNP